MSLAFQRRCSGTNVSAGTNIMLVSQDWKRSDWRPILEQLELMGHELVKQIDGIPVEALGRQAEGMDEHAGTADP
jgi:hypothetical protein